MPPFVGGAESSQVVDMVAWWGSGGLGAGRGRAGELLFAGRRVSVCKRKTVLDGVVITVWVSSVLLREAQKWRRSFVLRGFYCN